MFNKQIAKFVTNNKFLLEEYPIQKYSKNPPSWFKDVHVNLNKYMDEPQFKTTVKACSGIWDFLKNAYILRWNFDLEITINKDGTFNYGDINKDMLKRVTWFGPELFSMHTPIADDDLTKNTIKLEMNWDVVSSQNGKLLFTEPFFDYNRDYRIIPGVVEPKYVHAVNVIIEPLKDKIIIKRGEPALAVIPLDNQKIVSSLINRKDNDMIERANYKQNTLGSHWYEKYRKSYKKQK